MMKYFFVLICFGWVGPLLAAPVEVSSIDDLQKAIDKATPGASIILKDGTYYAEADIRVSCSGTKEQPIIIRAQTVGGAIITGKGGFNLLSPASYIVIRGFKFTHAASHAKSAPGTRFCRWTRNVFETPGKGEYLTIAGDDHEIDYNTFQHKTEMGRILAIRGEGSQIAKRLHIHHNYFYDFPDQGGANGAETLQFGLSGLSLSASNSIVEYNLFEKCHGENELISVKASGVVLRYNTIRNCPAQLTLRHGNRCEVYGNFFFNTPGLRIYGDDHAIFSNYFENCSQAITIGNGGAEVADGAPLTSHDRPDRVLIAFNTLVDNQKNIVLQARQNGLGATAITIADNIIQGGAEAVVLSGPLKEGIWKNNWLYKVSTPGDIPIGGYKLQDAKLVKDGKDIYRLSGGSAAIGAGDNGFKAVTVDMDTEQRKDKWDIGADQYIKGKGTAQVLRAGQAGAAIN